MIVPAGGLSAGLSDEEWRLAQEAFLAVDTADAYVVSKNQLVVASHMGNSDKVVGLSLPDRHRNTQEWVVVYRFSSSSKQMPRIE